MDERLNRALEFANLRNTQSLEKRRLKEKLKVDLTIGYNGGIFFIDRTLIAFLNAITPEEGLGSSIILDEKMNPVLIDDLIKFKSCEI